MNHYITPDNQIYGFDDDQKSLIPVDAIEIPSIYTFAQYPFLSVVKGEIKFDSSAYNIANKAQTIALYENAAQTNLDSVAKSWGYDSLVSAVSYINSTNPQFKADAEALIEWRDSYWMEAYTIKAGNLPSTADAFVAMLPVAPTKPVV